MSLYKAAALLVVFAVTCFGVSCDLDPCGSTPEAFMKKANVFFAEAKRVDYPVDSPRWETFDAEAERLVEVCLEQHKTTLTPDQRKAFRQGIGQYYLERYGKAGAKELLRQLDEGIDLQLKKVEDWLDKNL